MTWQDLVNGTFELLGGFAVMHHCLQLIKDKILRGVSYYATGFFFSWGVWNLYYYPHLGQWASFWGGVAIVSANCVYVSLMVYYHRKEMIARTTP